MIMISAALGLREPAIDGSINLINLIKGRHHAPWNGGASPRVQG